MQTSIPLEYGNYYHIYNRGNNRENIFFEERNYHYFLKLYVKYITPVADTYAYCLMKNHFHFLVRIKTVEEQASQIAEVSLVGPREARAKTSAVSISTKVLKPNLQFGHMFNSYAKAINGTYRRTGSLFQSRFGRKLVDSDRYFMYLITYIHQNPQKHGFVDDFRTYPFSSYQAIRHQKASRIKIEKVLDWFGGLDRFEECHQTWVKENEIEHLIEDDFF